MKVLVITSIAQLPTELMLDSFNVAQENNCQIIVVEDQKSGSLDSPGVRSISPKQQIVGHLPWNSYSRKNIGYLEALKGTADWIIETDDDNLPTQDFFNLNSFLNFEARIASNIGWLNVYKYFGNDVVWPRGFPLNKIRNHEKSTLPIVEIDVASVGVFQSLADNDPDVDAIFRLTQNLPQTFEIDRPISLSDGTVCPFNAQATWWNVKNACLMYFPSTISWRVADIWRSYIATRILQANSLSVVFTGPLVKQIRNNHDLLLDFKEEINCYLQAELIWKCLLAIETRLLTGNLPRAILTVYEYLVEANFIPIEEIPILKAWLNDIVRIQNLTKL
jgi:hypothetical protein